MSDNHSATKSWQDAWSSGPANWSLAEMWAAIAGVPLAITILLGLSQDTYTQTITWAVDHHVLITGHPLVPVPAGHGAGLDLPRLAIALSLVLLLGGAAALTLARHIAHVRLTRHERTTR